MNILNRIKILRALIASLEESRTASLTTRVALKFLKAELAGAWKPNRHLNELAYAQTLDGVSGSGDKYSGNWRKTQRRFEKEIQEHPEKYQNFDHEWLNPQSHDIYAPLFKSVQKFTGVGPDDKEDVILLTMSGVSNSGVRGGVGFHRAGEKLRDGIISGKISPTTRGSGSSVPGKVIGYAMNAHRDILRKIKRQRGDKDMSNVTVRSKKPQSTDIDVVLQTTPAGAWDFMDFKEEFKRGLGKAEGVEGLLTNLSEGRSAIIARKVLEAAEKFWRQDRGLQKVKKKDKHRGRDLMLAYVDLLQKGHAKPRMDEITVIFRNLPVDDDEVARMRTETPDRNFHNDIKKSKTLGLASFGKLMQKNKRIIDALAEWAQGNTGRRASMSQRKTFPPRGPAAPDQYLVGDLVSEYYKKHPQEGWNPSKPPRQVPGWNPAIPLRNLEKGLEEMWYKHPEAHDLAGYMGPGGNPKYVKDVLTALKKRGAPSDIMRGVQNWLVNTVADSDWGLNPLKIRGYKWASMGPPQRVAVRYARQLLARHPKGPMSKEDKEKLMEENPKFKEMNEEHGDKFKKKVLDAE